MTRVAGGVLVLLAALIQLTWAQHLALLGVLPNLVLVVVVAITWTYGQRAGLAWACVAGLILDLAAPGPLGPHALALLCGSYVTGLWARNVEHSSVMQPALTAAISTAIYSAILVGADDTLGLPVPSLALAAQVTGLAALYNAVLTVPVIVAISRTHAEVHA